LNRIYIKSDNSHNVTISSTVSSGFVELFILKDNAFLHLDRKIVINSDRFMLLRYEGINAFAYLDYSDITVNFLISIYDHSPMGSATLKMYNCYIKVYDMTQFKEMTITGGYNRFKPMDDSNSVIADFSNCILDNFGIGLYPYNNDNPLVKFSYCTSNKLSVYVYGYDQSISNPTLSASSSPVYFENCTISYLSVNCGTNYLAPVGFFSCLINNIAYYNYTYLIQDDGEDCNGTETMDCCFIIADRHTVINQLSMYRDNDDSSFVSSNNEGYKTKTDKDADTKLGSEDAHMIRAYESSIINVHLISEYGTCFTTSPAYISLYDSITAGGYIYIDQITNNPNPSESSGVVSKLTANDDEE
jgi:hypothetical protein